jgi:hypothetical protein
MSGVVTMNGNQTVLDNRRGKHHSFFYDYSFWSADRSDASYASQDVIFDKIGRPLLDRSFEGYNCCLFAYGQVCSSASHLFSSLPRVCLIVGLFLFVLDCTYCSDFFWQVIQVSLLLSLAIKIIAFLFIVN